MGSSSDNSYFRLEAFSHDGDISRQLREIHAPGSWLDCKACPLLVPPRLLISAGVRRVSAGAHRVCRSKSAEPNLLGFVRPEILDQEPSGDENLDVAKDKIAQQ
jgi:hypothetical protein